MADIETIRAHLPQYFSDAVAKCAGLTLSDLQRVIAGSRSLEPWQIAALAERMHIKSDRSDGDRRE